MKLLIVTQKVNKHDQILGFFHRWIIEFSKQCESVVVICLEKGEYDVPENVRVLTLGKETLRSRIAYVRSFYSYIWNERGNYDAVFVHMNPEYVLMGAVLWLIFGKKVCLWYTHKSVDTKLRLAEKFVSKIFSASRESFRLKSNKVVIMGHGIDTDFFKPYQKKSDDTVCILSVSRISQTKNQLAMIDAVKILRDKGIDCELTIVGAAVTKDDIEYECMLKEHVFQQNINSVRFVGAISPEQVLPYYQGADIFLNLSKTGSLDKAVLEAMSCEVVPVTSNEAFEEMLEPHTLFLHDADPEYIAGCIAGIVKDRAALAKIGMAMRDIVVRDHTLPSLISRVVSEYQHI